jgi:hypothetical protein
LSQHSKQPAQGGRSKSALSSSRFGSEAQRQPNIAGCRAGESIEVVVFTKSDQSPGKQASSVESAPAWLPASQEPSGCVSALQPKKDHGELRPVLIAHLFAAAIVVRQTSPRA